MRPLNKLGVAGGILGTGMLLALLFRHDPAHVAGPPTSLEQAVPRRQESPGPQFLQAVAPPPDEVQPAALASIAPPQPSEPAPPAIGLSYPSTDSVAPLAELPSVTPFTTGQENSEGASREEKPSGAAEPENALGSASQESSAACTHVVADGDTLPALAERYLGDAGRASEIFEANRSLLSDEELLPIGAVLRIPAR